MSYQLVGLLVYHELEEAWFCTFLCKSLGFALNPEIQSLPLKHGLSGVILKKIEVFTKFL